MTNSKIKAFALSVLLFTLVSALYAQNEGALLLITNRKAKVVIDGDEVGVNEKGKPNKYQVAAGEHYLQVFSIPDRKEKSEVFTIEAGKQRVIKVDFQRSNYNNDITI